MHRIFFIGLITSLNLISDMRTAPSRKRVIFSGTCLAVVATGDIIGTCHIQFTIHKLIIGEYGNDTITVTGSINNKIQRLRQKIEVQADRKFQAGNWICVASSDTLRITVEKTLYNGITGYLFIDVSD
jgi:hypothetical protein